MSINEKERFYEGDLYEIKIPLGKLKIGDVRNRKS